MTPEEQMPMLLDAFRALEKPLPQPHAFVAGGLTHTIAEWRIEADASPHLHGEVLHKLLDAVQRLEVAELEQKLAEQKLIHEELQDAVRLATANITKVLKLAQARQQTEIYKALKQCRNELKAIQP